MRMLSTFSMIRRHLLLLCALLLFCFSASLLWPALKIGRDDPSTPSRQRGQAISQAWGYGGISGISAPSPTSTSLPLSPTPTASTPTPLPAPSPSAPASGDSSGGGPFGISADTISTFVIQGFILPLGQQLQFFIANELGPNSQLGLVWTTDPAMTNDNPAISQLWESLFLISLILLGAVLAWNFLRIMMKSFTVDYANALESIPKIIFAVIVSALSLRLVGLLIGLNDDLCAFVDRNFIMTAQQTGAPGHNPFLMDLDTSNTNLLYLVTWFIYALMWLFLLVEAAIRLGILDVCIVIAPLASLCFASKETEAIGRFWLNTLVAVTFIQFIQVLCVVIGTQIIPLLQTGDNTLIIVRLLVSVGILYLAVTIPRYFQQAALHAMQAAHSQFWGGMTNAVRSVGSVAGLVVRGFL